MPKPIYAPPSTGKSHAHYDLNVTSACFMCKCSANFVADGVITSIVLQHSLVLQLSPQRLQTIVPK
eukprot:3653562-Amphidinium_carterae.2